MKARAIAGNRVERGPGWTLHLLDWRHADLPKCDAFVEDPPYGKRTHLGQRHERAAGYRERGKSGFLSEKGDLGYDHLEFVDVEHLIESAHAKCCGWIVTMTSHDLIPAYEVAIEKVGRYGFAPVSIVIPGMNVRLAGDGPSNWTIYTMVSRLRKGKKNWGTKKGAYAGYTEDSRVTKGVKGSKPLSLMEAIVRDYSAVNDLVLDRFAGSGTTGVAAIRLGRRFVGYERKTEHFEIALERLRRAKPIRALFADQEPREEAEITAFPGSESW